MEDDKLDTIKTDMDSSMTDFHGQEIYTWNTRKKLSVYAFVANCAIIFTLLFVPIEKISAVKDLISTFIWSNVVLIISYMGSTAITALSTIIPLTPFSKK